MSWDSDQIPAQNGRVAIVTGANSGLGLETARALVQKGAHVVMACRSPEKSAAALQSVQQSSANGRAELSTLDLANLGSVRAFAKDYITRFDRLDLLINNAGVMVPPEGKTADGFELQFGTNHLGHFALTGQLLEALTPTEGARVVSVSSVVHKGASIDFDNLNAEKGYRAQSAYGQSKLANLLFTLELQRRLEGTGVLAVAAHPGFASTNLMSNTLSGRFMAKLLAKPPNVGALPSLYAATAAEVEPNGYYGPTGFMDIRGPIGPAKRNEKATDADVAKQLWDTSEQMTGITYDVAISGDKNAP